MSIRTHARFKRAPLALALVAVMSLPAGSAFAQSTTAGDQDKASEASSDTQKKAEKVETLDAIVVTGSRIARDTFNSVSPVTVINREEATMAGFTSTAGVLQSNAVTGGTDQINNAYGGYVVNGGPGVNTLSLRGLGATRTLLLLNGRRVAPAGSRGAVGSADLNVLPNIMIDHIEVLKDGASSIYGSDAVAGVVNIITQPKVDGVTIELQNNGTEAGGGTENRVSIKGGKTADNWRISGSLEFYKRSAVTYADRDFSSGCPTPMVGRRADGSFGADDYIDPMTGEPKCWTLDAGGVTVNTLGTAYLLGRPGQGSLGYYGTYYPEDLPGLGGLDYFNRWRPNSGVTDGDLPGFEGVDYYGRDSFDPRMLEEHLLSPTNNYTAFLQGGLDLNALGDAELYFENLASRRRSNQVGFLQHTIDYAVGSPLLGDLSWLPRMAGAPADGSTGGRPIAARAFLGWGLYKNKQEVDFNRATVGLRGNLGSSWKYDVYASHARSFADYYTENRLTDRYRNTLNVVSDGNGGFMCADAAARAAGCVAAPMLSTSVLAGNLPAAYKNYVMQWTHGTTEYTEKTLNAGVNGPIFDLPYGTIYGAFGVEYRDAEIDDTPDPNSVANNLYGFTASQPTRGKDAVKEAYAELQVPLLSGIRFAQELSLNLSGRVTDYDSYGSDTTYKIGLMYTPISALSFRASHGTSFRAPALFEQFLGATSGFNAANGDPCNAWASKTPESNVYVNCSSLGLAPNFDQKSSIKVLTKGGAETGLAAETSVATTAGIVFQPEMPEWFGTLSLAADYYDIQVDNGVARLSGAQVLGLCYNSLPAEFTAGTGYCGLVQRAADNTLSVTTGYVNVSTDIVRGWDFTARYTRDIGPGSFRANLAVSHYLEQSGRTFPDSPLVDNNGRLYSPDFTGQLDMSYNVRNWNFRYGVDWVGKMSDYEYYQKNGIDYTDVYKMDTANYFSSNASVQYRGDKWSVTAGLRNLTDKRPPQVSSAVAGVGNTMLYSGYDWLGRSYFLNFTKSF
ncbi:TonB-dependent receptor [Thermomonas fusca]|uniref:TonB-dependent receptor n=2 Tax=Thermomonas fusca TaxID=215690 RepID=A0A5R9PEK6_9GAMM|nr:TonB-dependent receptor [Thermomonas fusca]